MKEQQSQLLKSKKLRFYCGNETKSESSQKHVFLLAVWTCVSVCSCVAVLVGTRGSGPLVF